MNPSPKIIDRNVADTLGLRECDQKFVEDLWATYWPFAEPRFVARFGDKSTTQAMFWEMFLTCVLLQEGHDVKSLPARKGGRRGPDVLVEDHADGNKRVWFEAIACGCGDKEDAVPDFAGKGCHNVPDREITLRYTGALRTKREAYRGYADAGEVKPDEACVIAINAGGIPTRLLEDGVPRIIKALLPFGAPVVHIDLRTNRIVDETYEHRPLLLRAKGDPAPTTFFEDKANSLISAVVFSSMNYWLMSDPPEVIGHDLICVHNPLASVPIRRGFFAVGREFWIDGDRLIGKTMPKSAATFA